MTSTSDVVRARVAEGEREGLWLRADVQTRGRGRHGRVWVSPPGNLHSTLLLRPKAVPERAASLSLVGGLAVAEALRGLGVDARLKWPNDVVVPDSKRQSLKIAGVLPEALIAGGRLEAVLLGFGVNVGVAPAVANRGTTSLKDLGVTVPPQGLLELVAPRFAEAYRRWTIEGFAALRGEWLELAWGLGVKCAIDTGGGKPRVEGVLDGVALDGQALLRLTDGTTVACGSGELLLAAPIDANRAEPC